MNIKLIHLLFLVIFACSPRQETNQSKTVKSKDQTIQKAVIQKEETLQKALKNEVEDKKETPQNNCDDYFKSRYPNDSVKASLIDEIISIKGDSLSANNLKLLKSLKTQEKTLAFKHSINPVFRLKKEELSLIFYPHYERTKEGVPVPVSKEIDLIKRYDTTNNELAFLSNKIKYFPQILDSIYSGQEKPFIYFYTPSKMDSTRVIDLGKFYGECLYYHEYILDPTYIAMRDSLLLASSMKLDLAFGNEPRIDSLIQEGYNKACLDCPSSEYLAKTFAKLEGTDNLYLTYADSFPINDEYDTPFRALVMINEGIEVKYLWYSEVDLFGCSCL
ncbi:hypothetical protein [Marivirga harenae]|uniref:hypothetical protein n=1 Tax=Marivirga harenae TaxID=2010992 RepID=UPI0026DEB6A3|nr:hypothetical protein [Marivirga harenae]WKV13221.1 hypothetical protein Q3Y49_05190 [Marivirga harenae]|tara:strand:- start:20879 stop:21874 length:996 start_codon:yes stop_codon:yes gene_type:complete